jgi:hypothetical protein
MQLLIKKNENRLILLMTMIDSISMRPLFKKILYFVLVASLLSLKSLVAYAEETKKPFSWNSNFIKKSEPSKKKGVPANPPKKKSKGSAIEPAKNLTSDELTDEEKKLIQTMSNEIDSSASASTLKNTVRPPAIRAPRAPRPFQIPQPPRVPQNPNHRIISIPSVPTAFSSNSNSNTKPEVPTSPSK